MGCNRRFYFSFFLILFFPLVSSSQFGPGGVGNSTGASGQPHLRVWLSADNDVTFDGSNRVSSWGDRSGNASDLTQGTTDRQPIYQSAGGLNGNPSVLFDGFNDYLRYDVANFVSDYSAYLLVKVDSINAQTFHAIFNNYYNAGSGGTNDSFQFDSDGSSPRQFHFYSNSRPRTFGDLSNQWTTVAATKNGTSLVLRRDYVVANSYTIGGSESNNFRDYMLGSNRDVSSHLGAQVSEMFIYSDPLNAAQINIVENYLASKYSQSVATDLFAYDAIHFQDVAGIGRASVSAVEDSSFSSILGINKATHYSNGDYIFVGHNNGSLTLGTSEPPNGDVTFARRVAREWRVDLNGSNNGATDTLSISIDLTGFSLPAGFTDFVVFTDNDGNFTAGASAYSLTQVGASDYYFASDVIVQDGGFLTIGAIDREIQFQEGTSTGLENTVPNPSIDLILTWPYPAHLGPDVTVSYSDAGSGTATSGGACGGAVDYTFSAGSATITAGNSTTSISPLTICDDATVESSETIIIPLSGASNASIGSNATHTYSISDDENPRKVSFQTTSAAINEGNAGTTRDSIQVKIPTGTESLSDVVVNYLIQGASTATGAGDDYTMISGGSVTISPGDTTAYIVFDIIGDTDIESNETILFELTVISNGTLETTNTEFTYTITNDEALPVIQFENLSNTITEGNLTVPILVFINTVSAINVEVAFAIQAGGSATTGVDFSVLTSSPLTIVAGDTSSVIEINLLDDALQEINESFVLNLSSPVNATLGSSTSFTFIIDDDENFGSTGPGGVGDTTNVNELKLWIRSDVGLTTNVSGPDTLVSAWTDASANDEVLLQTVAGNRPKRRNNVLNGYPIIEFDGTDDFMLDSSPFSGDWQADFTMSLVFAPTTNSEPEFTSFLNNFNNPGGGGSDDSFQLDTDGSGNLRFQTSGSLNMPAISTGTYSFVTIIKNGTSIRAYQNGDEVPGSPLAIGANDANLFRDYVLGRNRNASVYHPFRMAELIIFESALSESRRRVVENYLAGKYDIAFDTPSNELYSYNATHPRSIQGIGYDGTTYHIEARPSILAVQMDNSGDWITGDYAFFGHDTADLSLTNTDVPSGYEHRMNRVWRVDITGTARQIRFSLNLSGFDVPNPNDITVLVSSTSTFATGTYSEPDPDVTTSLGVSSRKARDGSTTQPKAIKGKVDPFKNHWIAADPVTLNDGDYISIASTGSNSLPIEMAQVSITTVKRSTSSNILKESAQLSWTTLSESNNYGFEILRSFISSDSSIVEDENLLFFVEGAGFSTSPIQYQYVDNEVEQSGQYAFRIKQIDFDGSVEWFGPYEYNSQIPDRIELYQNYPNPFNPSTTIRYDIAKPATVVIEIYSILGQKVRTLVNQTHSPGRYSVRFDGTGLGSGIYLYRMSSDGKSITKKLLLIK